MVHRRVVARAIQWTALGFVGVAAGGLGAGAGRGVSEGTTVITRSRLDDSCCVVEWRAGRSKMALGKMKVG